LNRYHVSVSEQADGLAELCDTAGPRFVRKVKLAANLSNPVALICYDADKTEVGFKTDWLSGLASDSLHLFACGCVDIFLEILNVLNPGLATEQTLVEIVASNEVSRGLVGREWVGNASTARLYASTRVLSACVTEKDRVQENILRACAWSSTADPRKAALMSQKHTAGKIADDCFSTGFDADQNTRVSEFLTKSMPGFDQGLPKALFAYMHYQQRMLLSYILISPIEAKNGPL